MIENPAGLAQAREQICSLGGVDPCGSGMANQFSLERGGTRHAENGDGQSLDALSVPVQSLPKSVVAVGGFGNVSLAPFIGDLRSCR